MSRFLYTSESVAEGHPDKVADQISDAVLDAIIEQDPKARVACESYVTTGLALVGGEITTSSYVNIPDIHSADVAGKELHQVLSQHAVRADYQNHGPIHSTCDVRRVLCDCSSHSASDTSYVLYLIPYCFS